MPLVEDDPISRLERQFGADFHPRQLRIDLDDDDVARTFRDSPDPHAAVLGKSPLDQLLMIDAVQEPMRESAGETLREIELLPGTDFKGPALTRGVDRRAIRLRRGGHVMRALQ